MPRITHVISSPWGVGGAERIVAALVAADGGRGWEQTVLNPFARRPERPALPALFAPGTYLSHACERPGELPAMRRWLRGQIERCRPDILHAHLFHAGVTVAALRRQPESRLVLTHHHGSYLSLHRRFFQESLDRVAGRRYDKVVAVSEGVRRFLLSRYRYSPAKVACIPNGWDGAPEPRCGTARRPTVICVARLRPEKGHEVLLSAFRQVVEELPDAELVLLGDGELGELLRARVTEFGLSGHVRFEGSVDDVWPHLARAHVFALPSFYESLGIAVLEAMAAGLPVVASAVGEIPELVEPGVTGELVAAGDESALATELVRLLRSPELRQHMGGAGRQRAERHRSETMIDQYFALYDELLDGRALAR